MELITKIDLIYKTFPALQIVWFFSISFVFASFPSFDLKKKVPSISRYIVTREKTKKLNPQKRAGWKQTEAAVIFHLVIN